MAKQTIVQVFDDITGEPDAAEVQFGHQGTEYVIDLSQPNRAALEKALAPFVAAARPIRPPRASATSATAREAEQQAFRRLVRQWWTRNEDKAGRPANRRGRIPADVVDAYKQHQLGLVPAARPAVPPARPATAAQPAAPVARPVVPAPRSAPAASPVPAARFSTGGS
ncbi:Lsr2 family protein [Micromonospora sp. NPDC006766]|uniref:histone-like nucleoid-structuring protein Lsr2 n=1 Tax=Micromonospora sp. NPDC006766 TaxID=3154778 RepID=UPI0033EE68A3